MNTMRRAVLPMMLALAGWLAFCTPSSAEDATEKGFKLSQGESLGGLKLDLPEADLLALLGKPEKKGKDIEWEALGEYVQEWTWTKQGVSANMVSLKKGGKKKVLMFTATAPFAGATKKGIRIGSTPAEVAKAYGSYRDKEMSTEDAFIAGTVYGGLQFRFKGGKVVEIFFGASAE